MIDFLIIVFCLLCLLRGIFRGSVSEAFSILGIFIGLLFASAFYEKTSLYIFSWIDNTQMRNLCGYLLVFGFIPLVFNFLGLIVSYVFNIRVKGVYSRVAGAGIGTFKGILFISSLCIPLVTFLPKNYAGIKDSALFSLESALSEEMVGLISDDMQEGFTSHIGWYSKSCKDRKRTNP